MTGASAPTDVPHGLAATPRDAFPHHDGTARLYRFRPTAPGGAGLPLLLVPSVINRWYVLDLKPSSSLAEALVGSGLDTWCLDWGVPQDEDRYLTWDELVARLRRAVRAVQRETGAPRVGLLGYCVGGTLSAIHSALNPQSVAALVNLAGPVDFSRAGLLGTMVDARYFDAEAVAAAGNVSPAQMQSGFVMLRPTAQIAKWVTLADRAWDPEFRSSFEAMEAWAGDNIPFPAAAYSTYIRELYQENRLCQGKHRVAGRAVDLSNITCPVMTVVASKDTICPPDAARALNDRCGSKDKDVLTIPGGHVGAVVGSKAAATFYPALSTWLRSKLCN